MVARLPIAKPTSGRVEGFKRPPWKMAALVGGGVGGGTL
jgi:hypothetical protein